MMTTNNAFITIKDNYGDAAAPSSSSSSSLEHYCCFLPMLAKTLKGPWEKGGILHSVGNENWLSIDSDTDSETDSEDSSSTSSRKDPLHPKPLFRTVPENGNKIGDYTFGKELGEGTFGFVVLAKTPSGEEVAIKSIKMPAKVKGRDFLKTLFKEAQIMRDHGHHPNIVPLQDSMSSSQGRFYMAMPRATTDLFEVMDDPDIVWKQPDFLQQVMWGILSAMVHLHERGVAHMDLKPENVLIFTSALDEQYMLSPGCRLEATDFKVADFGYSRQSPNLEVVNDRVGTAPYLAPEMAFLHCLDGRMADMWSVGVMMINMRDPRSRDYFAYLGQLVRENRLRKYSRDLDVVLSGFERHMYSTETPHADKLLYDLVLGLLTRDPEQRLTASEALQHPWFQVPYGS